MRSDAGQAGALAREPTAPRADQLIRLLLALTLVLASGSRARAQSDTDDAAPMPIREGAAAQEPPSPPPADPDATAPTGPQRIGASPTFVTTTPATTTTTTTTASTPDPTPAPRTTTATTRTPTVAPPEAEEPEPESDGRDVDFIWIEVEGGISTVNLIAFRNADFAGGDTEVFREITGTGPMVGAALGFRVYWLAVGARMTFAAYEAFQIGTVGGDVQLRLPIPIVEPYIRVGAGYAWQGDANYESGTVTTATTVSGWSFDAALGFDIFVTNWLTLGAGAGFDLLNMTRQRDPTQMCMSPTEFCPGRDGDAIGYQLRGFAQAGLHF